MTATMTVGRPMPARLRVLRLLQATFAPDRGLLAAWFAVSLLSTIGFGPLIGGTVIGGTLTVLLLLMLAVAAYLPPTGPLRESSALAARVADLLKVAGGALLFGAAATYGVWANTVLSAQSPGEQFSLASIWSLTWPILTISLAFGSIVVGWRLGWDFRHSTNRSRLVAIGKVRSWLPDYRSRKGILVTWLASVALVTARSGGLMWLGPFIPWVVAWDVYLASEYIRWGA
ncbi:hypothetical protein [Microbacterium sp. NPDC091662]|uniref:hypothetical protein n=1 Tax=Microbacterium sp. NPDC091662 TaxID=3364211 RepID=UPI0038159B4D